MKNLKLFSCLFSLAVISACSTTPTNNVSNGNINAAASATPAVQNLTLVDRPQKIRDQMAARGSQDEAQPTLTVIEPKAGATVTSSTVKVKLIVSGDLKGYIPHMDPETKMGNHIHIILDNQPYEAYYNLDREFELRNVSDGEHTLRVFPSRPWHESYKNDGAFQMVTFTVKDGGGNADQPTTTANGNLMANAASNSNTATAPTPEGKDMATSTAGRVDTAKPLLTYSRPKGEYKGGEADAIMIDFWLFNGKLQGDGGEYRVRYTIDGAGSHFIDKWEPVWLGGWTAGKHSIKLELVDKDGNTVDNGGYNATTREITVTR